MLIRARTASDLRDCAELATTVRNVDGYPAYLRGSIEDFLSSPQAIGAWVTELGEDIVGHVAMHSSASEEVMELARNVTGHADHKLAVVARLLVSPTCRRKGVGRALLDTAATSAWAIGRVPILDVVIDYTAAV